MLAVAKSSKPAVHRAAGPVTAGLSHRCMLNPGRAIGPDGEAIGPMNCTMARQCVCQAHRRSRFARLHSTLPKATASPDAV